SMRLRSLFASVLFVALGAVTARAQTMPTSIPSPAQAQQMMQSDPGMLQRLQQMLQSSGLTPDQVRDRLRAAGYPDSLLDQYLPGGKGADSTAFPGDEVFAALRTLGVGDSTSLDSLS